MKAIAIIPARGGSKGIPRKNLVDFCGVPLLLWQARACAASRVFEAVIISSDDAEILQLAADSGFLSHRRSAEASSDTASSEAVMSEVWQWYQQQHGEVEVLCLAQATSPLTESSDYVAAWTLFTESGADSLVTVTRQHRFLWQCTQAGGGCAAPLNYDPVSRPRRQDWDGLLVENGAFYFVRAAAYGSKPSRLQGKIVAYEMEEWKAPEVDSLTDLEVCRAIATSRGWKA